MKNPLSRLANDTVIYGLGGLLNRAISIILLPLFTHYLSPKDYGIIALVGILSIALTGILSLGTGSSMGILYYETEDQTERNHIIWTTALTVLLNCIFWCILGWIFAHQISLFLLQVNDYVYIIRLAFITLALGTIVTPFWSYLRMENKAKSYVILTTISTLVGLILSILFVVHFKWGVLGLYQAQLWSQIVGLLLTLLAIFPLIPWGIKKSIIKPLVKIGFPSIFGIGAFFVIDYSDRALLQHFTDTAEVGLYSLGYGFGRLILLPVDAFSTAWPAYFISFINKRDEAEVVFGKVLKYYIFVIGTLVLPFFAFARPVVTLITAPNFHSIYTIVGWVAVSYFFKGCYLIFLAGIVFAKKLIIQTRIEWIAAGINLVLNLWLIPQWHKEGAVISTLVSYASLPILTYLLGRQYLKVDYDWVTIGKWLISFIVASASLTCLNSLDSIVFQTIASILIILIYLATIVFGLLSGSDHQILIKYLAQKLKNKP